MLKNTCGRKNTLVNNKVQQTSNKKIKLTPVSEFTASTSLKIVLVNMETNINSVINTIFTSAAPDTQLSET